MSERIVNVSPSLLADVVKCKTLGWVRHAKGFTSSGEAIKAIAGSAFHAAIAEFFDPTVAQVFNAEAALEAFHAIYDPAFARLTADKLEPALTPSNLHRVLARWLEMHPPSALPWRKVLMVEEAFVSREWKIYSVPLLDQYTTVRLICRPDLVVEDHDGCIRWVDTKTTGWRIGDEGWKRSVQLSLQTALYTDAVIQRFGERAALGGWINAIELRQMPSDASRTCATHKVKYSECGAEHARAEFIECMKSEELVAQAVRDAENAAWEFVRLLGEAEPGTLAMEGTANGACRFCQNATFCEKGRYPAALDSLLVYEPWVVSEGKRA